MKKFFKIIEKIVYAIAAIAIVAVIVLIVLGASANMHIEWQKYVPYMYLAAFLFAIYKALVIIFSSFYKIEITKREDILDVMNRTYVKNDIASQLEKSPEVDAIIESMKDIPQKNADAVTAMLKERLPEVVQSLVMQQVELEKKRLAQENEKRLNEINVLSANVSSVMERRSYLMRLEKEVKQRQAEERQRRLKLTEEYTSLVFTIAGSSVEDVEKVCDVVKSFISSGQMSADKNLQIPLNKKLRNAEVKQFVANIIRYNQKENLDAESFLQTTFGEWFSGKKENIIKNYSVLPKDSLVSKDGVEADLVNLRQKFDRREKKEDNEVEDADFEARNQQVSAK